MGATNSASGKQTRFYSLKAKASAEETPHFVLSEKINDKWQQTQKFDTITGLLNSAEIKEKEYQGAKFNVFVIELQDDSETSKIEMTHNSITYSLINSLASKVSKLDNYAIQVYRKKGTGKDGKTYWNGSAAIKVNGSSELQKWSIDPQSAPKKTPVLLGNGKPFIKDGKQVWDDTDVKIFWEDIFKKQVVDKLTPSSSQPQSTFTGNEIPSVEPPTGEPDDLPF